MRSVVAGVTVMVVRWGVLFLLVQVSKYWASRELNRGWSLGLLVQKADI